MTNDEAGNTDQAPVHVGEVTPASQGPVGRIEEIVPAEERVTNERLTRETVRWVLASILAGMFLLTVAAAFIGAEWGHQWANVRDWLQTVLPAETAILGSAIGFYFGTQRSGDGKAD